MEGQTECVSRVRRGRRVGTVTAGRILSAATTLIVVGLTVTGCSSGRKSVTTAPLFSANSPWRQAISTDPQVDPNSVAMIAAVQPKPGLFANLVEFGIPIYPVGADTPTHDVNCTHDDFGICPFAGWPVPIPDGAQANAGSDGVLVTVDESSGVSYEFWQAVKDGDTWSASFGAVNSIRGSGWGGAATGAGASRLGGVVRIAEIAAGEIPHALALQTQNACTGSFRPPALKSDGQSDAENCIPEGSRLQLDPSLDLNGLGLSHGELVVAKAMQRYGGYVMDVSGAPLSVSFERDTGAQPGSVGATYSEAGFRWDSDAMEHVPWDRLRVLK